MKKISKNNKFNLIFDSVLKEIVLTSNEIKEINSSLNKFLKEIKKKISKKKISAEIFVGGSLAKNTLMRKDIYDIDIFIRFDKKYKDGGISILTEKLIPKNYEFDLIHGSRDYFRIKISKNLFFEVIPVKKIRNSKEAENITDFSYYHVKYIKNRMKNKEILNEIILAKAFCYANDCYGAESYIKGFSGYSLELLIYHYKTFYNFIKSMERVGKEKLIIDLEKQYKNKNSILMDVNAAKLHSPIILIDPTFKQRNVLAGLSEETFRKFQIICRNFLRSPNSKYFEKKKIDLKSIQQQAKKNNYELIVLEISTHRQKGDIAGSKLLKFHNHLVVEASKLFLIKNQGINYLGEKYAISYIVAKSKKEIVLSGPSLNSEQHVKRFRNKYQRDKFAKIFEKNNQLYVKYQINSTLKEFLKNWLNKNKKRLEEMDIVNIKILK